MIGSTLALLTRSLRTDARMLRHHLFRLLFVGIIYFSVLWAQRLSPFFGAPGLQLFTMITWMNLIFVTLAGMGFFASAITEEKEEETLGLLKMAGVRPLSLLLGKSTSRLLTAGVLLSLQFPFTLLAITLGGVTIHQVLATYLSLLAYTALVANLALFWSVVSARTAGAATGVFVALLLFFIGPPLVESLCTEILRGRPSMATETTAAALIAASEWLISISIVTRVVEILTTAFAGSPWDAQTVSHFSAAAVLFGLSWLTFDYFTRTPAPAGPERRVLLKRPDVLRLLGAGRAWRWPLVWKDFHFVAGGRMMMLVKLICYGLLIVLFALLQQQWNRRIDVVELGQTTMIAMLVTCCIELSLLSSRIFQTELRWQTWPTLRMLPTPLPQIVYSKVGGCLLALFPALVCMAVGGLMAPRDFMSTAGDWFTAWGFWTLVLMFAAFVHLTALLSLFVKWGALPLAIGISIFCLVFVQMGIGLLYMLLFARFAATPSWFNETLIASVVISFLLGVNVGFQIVIGLRLRQLAAR